MINNDISTQLQQQVQTTATPLYIRGGNSKAFYGRKPIGTPLNLSEHCGITNYEPTELVITARAGTPLKEIENALSSENQMLAFEPPAFAETATLGGTIACNFSGPRRPYMGAARDFVLGCQLLNGKGEILHFGGEVMKNVAGYDVSRLMAGALGTLGALLEISLKVLPKPETELTLVQALSTEAALKRLHEWGLKPLPISASCFYDNQLFIRLSGSSGAVAAAQKTIGGEIRNKVFWQQLKEHQLPFFNTTTPLWRLSLSSDTPPFTFGECLYEWGGAQRWLKTDTETAIIREAAQNAGGYATLFRASSEDGEIFHPLPEGMMRIHQRLKQAFDPKRIFNIGKMYQEL
ncbi:MAG: glycolate oxidase subunit GlcE [Pseudomonadota bacterium]